MELEVEVIQEHVRQLQELAEQAQDQRVRTVVEAFSFALDSKEVASPPKTSRPSKVVLVERILDNERVEAKKKKEMVEYYFCNEPCVTVNFRTESLAKYLFGEANSLRLWRLSKKYFWLHALGSLVSSVTGLMAIVDEEYTNLAWLSGLIAVPLGLISFQGVNIVLAKRTLSTFNCSYIIFNVFGMCICLSLLYQGRFPVQVSVFFFIPQLLIVPLYDCLPPSVRRDTVASNIAFVLLMVILWCAILFDVPGIPDRSLVPGSSALSAKNRFFGFLFNILAFQSRSVFISVFQSGSSLTTLKGSTLRVKVTTSSAKLLMRMEREELAKHLFAAMMRHSEREVGLKTVPADYWKLFLHHVQDSMSHKTTPEMRHLVQGWISSKSSLKRSQIICPAFLKVSKTLRAATIEAFEDNSPSAVNFIYSDRKPFTVDISRDSIGARILGERLNKLSHSLWASNLLLYILVVLHHAGKGAFAYALLKEPGQMAWFTVLVLPLDLLLILPALSKTLLFMILSRFETCFVLMNTVGVLSSILYLHWGDVSILFGVGCMSFHLLVTLPFFDALSARKKRKVTTLVAVTNAWLVLLGVAAAGNQFHQPDIIIQTAGLDLSIVSRLYSFLSNIFIFSMKSLVSSWSSSGERLLSLPSPLKIGKVKSEIAAVLQTTDVGLVAGDLLSKQRKRLSFAPPATFYDRRVQPLENMSTFQTLPTH